MKQRLLGGHTGLRVSEFALGTGRLGTSRDGASDPAKARAALAAFADAGGSFIDTSSAYQGGAAETFTGDFLAETGREGHVIASKYGAPAEAAPAPSLVGSHRKAMVSSVENSLRRLRTDRIDLFFPHFDDGLTPVEEIMGGLDALVRAGKIVHIGLSNFPAWRTASAAMMSELRGWAPVAVLQLEYSLSQRSAEREHLLLARARGMGVMAYSPLGGGALTRATAGGDPEHHPVAPILKDVAQELGSMPAAVALAWVIAKGPIPILGARDADQLRDNLSALELQLSPEQIERLEAAGQPDLGEPYTLLLNFRARLGLSSPQLGAVL